MDQKKKYILKSKTWIKIQEMDQNPRNGSKSINCIKIYKSIKELKNQKWIKIHKTDQNPQYGSKSINESNIQKWTKTIILIKIHKTDQIPKKSNLWWNNPKPGLFPVGQDLSGLPPLFVRGVGHVQDVAIGEAQTPRG